MRRYPWVIPQPSTTRPHTNAGSRNNLRAAWWLAAVAMVFTLLVLRRPDAIFNPQFNAEDGTVWFQQAYNEGAISLLRTYGGYFQTISRLAALLALAVPLRWAPLVMNLIALAVEAAPALFLLSSRMRNIGSFTLRCGLAFVYLSVPNLPEIHANVTNSPWTLAILALLVIIAAPPHSLAGRTFDIAVLTLMDLTGPFCVLLLPIALYVFVARREQWKLIVSWVIAGGVLLQGFALVTAGHHRLHQTLGASFIAACKIIAGQIVLPALQGKNRLSSLAHSPHGIAICACCLTALAAVLFLYALWRGSLELRSLLIFALLVWAAALAFPTPNASTDHWTSLQIPGGAGRYWFIPQLATMVTFLWLLGSKRPLALRTLAVVLVCCMSYGIVKHWRLQPYPDLHFAAYARAFEQLPPGAKLTIPINPTGWSTVLVKK